MSKNFTELSAKEMNTTDGGLVVLIPLVPVLIGAGVGAVCSYVFKK